MTDQKHEYKSRILNKCICGLLEGTVGAFSAVATFPYFPSLTIFSILVALTQQGKNNQYLVLYKEFY